MIVRFNAPPDSCAYVSPEGDRVLIDSGPSEAGSHEVQTWLFCPRAWAYGRYGGQRGVHLPFVRGGIMHVGLAHHFARWAIRRNKSFTYLDKVYTNENAFYTPEEAQRVLVHHKYSAGERQMALRPVEKDENADEEATEETLLTACHDTLNAYIRRNIPTFRVLAVEDPQRIELPNGMFHTARVDMISLEPDGVYYDDFKSTAMTVKRAARMYERNLQLLALHLFGRQKYGPAFRGVRAIIIEANGKATYKPVNAPLLVNDVHALLTGAREDIRRKSALYGNNVRAYPPNGVHAGCVHAEVGSLCDRWRTCMFGD